MSLHTEQRQFWDENGFVIFEGFFSNSEINQINQLVSDLWQKRRTLDKNYIIDIFLETEQRKRVYFADAPDEAATKPYKLNDLFLSQPLIRDTVAGERIAPILQELLGGFPMVCNSLNFEFGSQQGYHFDTFYMPSPTPNKMVASWIALEDVTEHNGPLTYYPGSHKIPPYIFSNGSTIAIDDELPEFETYINAEIEKRGLKPEVLLASKGDVLIWHSQLFHGGSKITNPGETRKSLVTHYFTREDFPNQQPIMITKHSCYQNRKAQRLDSPLSRLKKSLKRLLPN